MVFFSMKPQLWLIKLVVVQLMSFKASDFIPPILVKKPQWYKINVAHKEMADSSPLISVNRLCDCNWKDKHSLKWCWTRKKRDYIHVGDVQELLLWPVVMYSLETKLSSSVKILEGLKDWKTCHTLRLMYMENTVGMITVLKHLCGTIDVGPTNKINYKD